MRLFSRTDPALSCAIRTADLKRDLKGTSFDAALTNQDRGESKGAFLAGAGPKTVSGPVAGKRDA